MDQPLHERTKLLHTVSDPPVDEELIADVKNILLEDSKVAEIFVPKRGIP